jgi:hypothetical protein
MYRQTYSAATGEWTPRTHWHAFDREYKQVYRRALDMFRGKKTFKTFETSFYVIGTNFGDYGAEEIHHGTLLVL